MNIRGKILTHTIKNLPHSYNLYVLCREYKKHYELNCAANMNTNGEFNVIKKILPNCAIVFDIGANIGDWTQLATAVNPKTIIHCFEPSKATYQGLLQKKFPTHIICNNFGLSSKQGQKDFYVFQDTSPGNSLYQRAGIPEGTQTQKEIVDLNTLEFYCKEKNIESVDFMKIDTEGHELEIFKGGLSLFKENKIKLIQFEYGGCQIDARVFLKDIFSFFAPFSYSFYKIFPKTIKYIPHYDQENENFQYQNWLVVSNDAQNLVAPLL